MADHPSPKSNKTETPTGESPLGFFDRLRINLRTKLILLMVLSSGSALVVAFLLLTSLASDPTMDRGRLMFAILVVVPLISFLLSWLVSSRLEHVISQPITQIARTALKVTEVQDYSHRLNRRSNDEIGELVTGFNGMLAEIEKRDQALRTAQRDLELKVKERTQELAREVEDRRQAEKDLAQQLTRISLLNHITRAIASHQDLESVLSTVLGELTERLPVDFGCILLLHDDRKELRVAACQEREIETAYLVWKVERWVLPVENCSWIDPSAPPLFVQGGEAQLDSPVFRKPRELGMQSAASLPLRKERHLQGLLVVARRSSDGFSTGEQEFLRALSEHVALAGHQASLHAELQSAYDELRQTQKAVMQHERLRALGQMASGIAHDVNNALSPVGGFAELLLSTEPNLSENARKYLGFIKTASDDIAHIVSRLREFYRARADDHALMPVDVNKLIRDVMDLTRPRWRDVAQRVGANIEARLNLCAESPMALGIEAELREALTNLIFNAVDAMPQGGTLTLCSRLARPLPVDHSLATPSTLFIEVADTGTGMDEETRQRCLEPFYSTKGQRGTGLGLAMVYGTMQRHKGTVEIESSPGEGTTLKLVLPLHQPKSPTSVERLDATAPLSQLRILFVDDEPLLRELIKEILETDGHEVLTASGGSEALRVFEDCRSQGRPPAVVITDLGMPRMDGSELTRRLKELSPSTPVIMMTGWGKVTRGEDDVRAPVDALIGKPPRIPELQAALSQVLRTPDPLLD